MKFFIYIFFFFFFYQTVLAFEVSVRFFNRSKQSPESNTQVLIRETKKIYEIDQDGYIQADIPTNGKYTFRLIKLSGFEDFTKRINKGQKSVLIYTDKKAVGGINILGKKKKTIISRHKVRYEEINRLPGSFGEALRGIQTLPGVNPVGGFNNSGDPVIRGAEPSSNIYMYDGLPIFYAFHWDTFSSVINNDLIKSIDVYTGVFPAKFDSVIGGIIEIESPERPKEESGTFRIGLWSSSVSYRKAFEKFYIQVGAKKGYLSDVINFLFRPPSSQDKIQFPNFSDSQLKIVYEITSNHVVSFTNLSADDIFLIQLHSLSAFDPLEDTAFRGSRISSKRGFNTAAIRYDWTPSPKFNYRVTFVNYVPYSFNFSNIGPIPVNSKSSTGYDSIQESLSWKIFSFLTIEAGLDYRILNYRVQGTELALVDPDNKNPNPYKISDPDFVPVEVTDNRKEQFSKSWANLDFQFGNFNFQPAVRYNYFSRSNQSSVSPRASISYLFPKVGKGLTVFSSGGKLVGFPNDVLSKLNTKSGNPDLKFEKVDKYGVGLEQKITKNSLVKIEAFRNSFYDLIVLDPYISDYIGLNPVRYEIHEYPLVYNKMRSFSNKGTGNSRGYELLIRKNSSELKINDWFGWLSYTWSKTFRNEHTYKRYTGEIYDKIMPTKLTEEYRWSGIERLVIGNFIDNSYEKLHEYDRTHIVNLVYGLKIKKIWQFGARWAYLTQNPIEPIIGSTLGFQNEINKQFVFSPVYAEDPFYPEEWRVKRMKPYHKLDLRVDRFYHYEWGYMNIYFSILNVYLRENLESDEYFNSNFPYSPVNPSPAKDTFNYIRESPRVPFIQAGIETRF